MKTLKNILIVTVFVCLLSACKSTQYYYQISQTKPVDESIVKSDNDDNGYYYQDENCRVAYNFWCEKGDAGFVITNLTDQVLYVMMDKSFFIKNGVSYDYFKNQNTTEVSAGKTVVTNENRIIGIAPHASKEISKYFIYTQVYLNCDLDRKPKSKAPATMTFTLQNSPVVFGNYITYKVGNEGQEVGVTNLFYTNRVTNYLKDDLFFTEKRYNCPNVSDMKEYTQTLIRFAPTTGYFVPYVK